MSKPKSAKALTPFLHQANHGSMDRRSFVTAALAAGTTIPTALSLFGKAASANPQKGGTLRIGMADGATSDNWNPAVTNTRYMIHMNHVNRNMLTEITSDNKLGPELAKSWEASSDAATWTFQLQEGVEFHNGKSFGAQDVVDTLNFHRNPDTGSAVASLLSSVEDIKADGDSRVTITLSSGNADLPYVMTDYHLCMLPSDGNGGVEISPIGTGAYMVESHDSGVRTALKRNPNFFKADAAYFDDVVFTSISDATARQTALSTRDIDCIDEVDLKTVEFLKRMDGVAIDEAASSSYASLPMRMDVAPFDNHDVQMALKYAMDREEWVQKIRRGYATIGNDHPIGPSMPFYAGDIEQRQYDPEKAKFHLKQAGHENLKIDLHVSDAPFAGGVDACLLYKEAALKAGIDVNVVREPNDGYWSDVWNKKPFCLAQWGARPVPDMILSLVYETGVAWNESAFSNERFDKILVEARAELDEAKRAELYREMQMIIRDDCGVVVPFFKNYVYARGSNLQHGPNLTGTWPLDGYKAAERWWFA
ncbi:MAG: ABC transporter substrate-binding protein [Pseudomonadota bacterium]